MKKSSQNEQDLKITLRDFIPPVFFKIGKMLKDSWIGLQMQQYTQITHIELGISLVFVGSLLIALLTTFLIPGKMADLAYSIYMYNADTNSVTLDAYVKANKAKTLLKTFNYDYSKEKDTSYIKIGQEVLQDVKVEHKDTSYNSGYYDSLHNTSSASEKILDVTEYYSYTNY